MTKTGSCETMIAPKDVPQTGDGYTGSAGQWLQMLLFGLMIPAALFSGCLSKKYRIDPLASAGGSVHLVSSITCRADALGCDQRHWCNGK